MIKYMLALVTVAVIAPVWSAETPVSNPAPAPTQEQMIEQFRTDLQAKRSDVMAKGLTLTSEQAAKFWPCSKPSRRTERDRRWSAQGDAEIRRAVRVAD